MNFNIIEFKVNIPIGTYSDLFGTKCIVKR